MAARSSRRRALRRSPSPSVARRAGSSMEVSHIVILSVSLSEGLAYPAGPIIASYRGRRQSTAGAALWLSMTQTTGGRDVAGGVRL